METILLVKSMILLCMVSSLRAKPTIYMKNDNDKLEPYLEAVSSTVIPIPVYRVSSGFNVRRSGKKKSEVNKPDGPIQLITSLKKMAADEKIKPH